jgi:aminocarboxymuconate-semialdehyde decarboxylase
MINGANFRTVTDHCWSASRRIDDMNAAGLGRQVLSPMPELLAYHLPAEHAQVLHRDLNEQMASVVANHPDRFLALGAVPLQDIDVAIAEMEHLARDLGLSGVEVGSNVNGVPIGAPDFAPFYAAAERLGLCVFVHAHRPTGLDRISGPKALTQALGFPTEIGLAAASVISNNVIDQYPALRMAFSHGGGSFSMLLARLQNAWSLVDPLRAAIPRSPREQARQLFFDTLVYDGDALAFLVKAYGPQSLLIGTDYPFSVMEKDPIGALAAGVPPGAHFDAIATANACRFLALD